MARGPNMTLFKKVMALFNFRENFDCFIKSTVLGVGGKGSKEGKKILGGQEISTEDGWKSLSNKKRSSKKFEKDELSRKK